MAVGLVAARPVRLGVLHALAASAGTGGSLMADDTTPPPASPPVAAGEVPAAPDIRAIRERVTQATRLNGLWRAGGMQRFVAPAAVTDQGKGQG